MPLILQVLRYVISRLTCKHVMICQNRAGIGPLLVASGRYRPAAGTSWQHVHRLDWCRNDSTLRQCHAICYTLYYRSLLWRHDERDGVSNHQLHDCYSNVYYNWGADQRKHQSSASLAFVRGIHRSPVNSPYKGPVTRKMFPFDDIIMYRAIIFH